MSEGKGNGTVISAALILGVSSLASRVVGLVRERVFTTTFGAGDTFDAFVAAFRIPDLIFNLVVIGALSTVFIPLFTDRLVNSRGRGKADAFTFSLSVLNSTLIIISILMGLFAIFAADAVPLITPGFSGEKLQLTVQLSRIMALQPILLTLSFVFSGVLNSFQRFTAYAVAPIAYNTGIIIGALVLYPWLGVRGLGWGVVLGALLHMLVQFPSVLKVGWRWSPVIAWRKQDVKTLWLMVVPRVFGLAAQQINLLVATVIGSTLLAGSISAFYLASNVAFLPIGIFGIAFAQAAFPTLAQYAARGQQTEFAKTLMGTARYILFFVLPASVFFFLLRAQIIRVLFGDGAFDWEDTILTFQTFGWLTISIFAQAIMPLLTRAFYVRKNTAIPVAISVFSIALNVTVALLLAPRLGVPGLAIAVSVESIVNAFLLFIVLRWQVGALDGRAMSGALLRLLAAALGAGGAVQLLKYPVAAVVDMQRFWGVFAQLTVATVGGGGMYLLLCWLFDCEELSAVRRYLPRRFRALLAPSTPRLEGLVE